jgi:two-component system nitrate/nitrite response regulator NarP
MKTHVSTLSTFRRNGNHHRHSAVTNGAAPRAQSRIRIVIADDHPITLAGLQSLLSGERDVNVVARCADGHAALRAVQSFEPDILVVDQDMPVLDGVTILKQLRAAGDQTPMVLLATANNERLAEALSLDVEGIVFKHSDPKNLIRCLREVRAGRKWLDSSVTGYPVLPAGQPVLDTLTRRQIEVARAAVSGLSNKELAQRLGVSEGTIKNHLHAIYERLQLDGRLALGCCFTLFKMRGRND